MNKKIVITVAVIGAGIVGGTVVFRQRADAYAAPDYRLSAVDRGSIHATVSATGSLSAVRTVEVGTQVSGQISAILVDFNDHVKKGQLIASIDPILQKQAVQDAQAGVARADAQVLQTRLEYERTEALYKQQISTASEYNTAQSNYAVAKANLTSAQIALDKARQNLAYTNIYAPIDGVIVERDMDVGQTVAASLSAPKLFVIANDLARMQIQANVDESDIGLIKPDQPVTFTVQSYNSESFAGAVRQVRLNATTVNNVVSYTAIIDVQNPSGKLLPGMTASVKFVTGTADNVLTVPTTALRFTPTSDMKTVGGTPNASSSRTRSPGATAVPGAPSGMPGGGAPGGMMGAPRAQGAGGANRRGTVWTTDASGALVAHDVRVGLSDGIRTQIEGAGLDSGTKVVIGIVQAGATPAAATTTTRNPLQGGTTGGRGPGGPPF